MVTASEELVSPNWFSARTRALYSLFSCTPWPDTVMYSVPFPEYGNGPTVAGATPSASSDTEKLSGKHVDGLWSGLHAVQHRRIMVILSILTPAKEECNEQTISYVLSEF